MAYGLKYQGEFTNISNVDYRLEIYEKDYSGIFYSLQMAGVPVVHTWNTDEPKAPVKGSSLTIKYLNKGSQPINNFFSTADDTFKVIFKKGSDVLFVGFLVQDDFIEPMLDYTHEVTLSATDNLGLLKDIALDLSAETTTVPCIAQGDIIAITSPVQNWINLTNINFTPVVGVSFTISGHPDSAMNATFTPTQVITLSSTAFRVRVSATTGDTVAAPCTINSTSSIPIPNSRVTLANIVHACLIKTGLELETYVYCNLFEDTHGTNDSLFPQTYIDPETFISGDSYDNCYSVLEKILSVYGLSLFQAYGRWNIVRWSELKYGLPNAFVYNSSFTLLGNDIMDAGWLLGFQKDTYPENGLTKQAIRPYEYIKEKFDYNQPKYLLKNYDLQKLGTLLRQYTDGSGNLIKEYTATSWEGTISVASLERFIRVTTDSLGNELSRYIITRGAGNQWAGICSKPIEISQGDKIGFSFSIRTTNSQPGNINATFGVMLYDGSTTRWLNNTPSSTNAQWGTGFGFTFNIPSGDNSNQWHNVEMKSQQAPFSGFVYVCLANLSFNNNPVNETWIKDIRFEYTPYINDSTKIVGHIHKDKQTAIIKNNQDVEIYADDSPRNSIAGTLFTGMFNGLLQDRTANWYRDGFTEARKLGDIITGEGLQERNTSRTKLEGNFRGINQDGSVSPLKWFNYNELPSLNFLFGNLEVDYYNDQFRCTAWELFKNGESDVVDDYTFTYIYDTK
jgi:hypothetical protein